MKGVSLLLAFLMQICGIMELPFAKGNRTEPVDTAAGADPFVVEHGGFAYYTYTDGGQRIALSKTAAYDSLTPIERKSVYELGSNGIVGDIWAPEIHRIGEKWYIVASALFNKGAVPAGTMPYAQEQTEHGDYYRYGFVLESKTDDIFGEYVFKARLSPDGMNNIDGTYLRQGGRLYYVCSAYLDVSHQCICIAEMENPYTLKADENGKSNSLIISKPTFSWEKHGWRVNEGPAVLYRNDKLYIVYSASGYSSGKYCMGMLTCNGDVMQKASWSKSPLKVYGQKKSEGIYHPGHCSFLYRDNGDIIMVYHATSDRTFNVSPRVTYMKKVSFFGDYPLFNT